MRRILLLVFVPLTGCLDFAGENGIATGPRPVHPDSSDTYWVRLARDEQRMALESIEELARDHTIGLVHGQIAISDGELPDGALAMIVQRPGSPERPILVLSRKTADQQTFLVGVTEFARRMHRASSPADPRVLWLSLSEDITEAGTFDSLDQLRASGSFTLRGRLADRLLSDATGFSLIDLPGVGRATLLRFD